MPNIEIKATLKDIETARSICKIIGKWHDTQDQTDTYYLVKNGRFKYREIYGCPNQNALIPYLRSDELGPKKSDYVFLRTDKEDISKTKELLEKVLGIDVIVSKTREIYLVGNVRIHLDLVKDLGTFIEFEAVYTESDNVKEQENKINILMNIFRVNQEDLIKCSYIDLMKNK